MIGAFQAGVMGSQRSDLISEPASPPDFGAALEGGYYTGAIWDEVTAATGERAIGTGAHTLNVEEGTWPFYAGQLIRVAPGPTNVGQVFMEGTVVDRVGTRLSINIASVEGSGTFSIWVVAARWKIIVAPKTGGEIASIAYKNANTAAPAACLTLTSGKRATDAMIAADTSTVYPLAHWAASLRTLNGTGLAGYNDWYIPARDELELIWRNLKPVTNANYVGADRYIAAVYTSNANKQDLIEQHGVNRNSDPAGAAYTASVPGQTATAAFQSTGAEKMEFGSRYYRSSSDATTVTSWVQSYVTTDPGAQASNLGKVSMRAARAVRRSIR